MTRQRVIKGLTRKSSLPMRIPEIENNLVIGIDKLDDWLRNALPTSRYAPITEAEICANHLREFINSFAELKHNTTDQRIPLSTLRLDIVVRLLYTTEHREMLVRDLSWATQWLANSLRLPERSAHNFSSLDAFCDYIVGQVIEKIGRGEWGSF